MNNFTQRDAFFNTLYNMADKDKDLIIVSADMSAPALDRFRKDFPNRFVNVGIAEQNAIQIASGLALAGKKVFVYAISPFITLRCLEQIRVSNAIMGIQIVILGMGTGFSYCNDGPTHHLIEDLSVLRVFPNICIVNLTDNVMAEYFAKKSFQQGMTSYIRIDKDIYPDIYPTNFDFSSGLAKLKDGDYLVITSGVMVHSVKNILDSMTCDGLGLIDIFKLPINETELIKLIRKAKKIITIEEHFLPGGLGSAVLEVLNDNGISIPLKRVGIDVSEGYKYCYKYGGREIIRKHYGIDSESIKNLILKFL